MTATATATMGKARLRATAVEPLQAVWLRGARALRGEVREPARVMEPGEISSVLLAFHLLIRRASVVGRVGAGRMSVRVRHAVRSPVPKIKSAAIRFKEFALLLAASAFSSGRGCGRLPPEGGPASSVESCTTLALPRP